jgi:type II secretory pathway pseudopilin PulG
MFSMPATSRVSKRFTASRRGPRGWTLLDLLLVSSVILIVAALFLPAVQHAREESRRNRCKNNLKEIGLAIYNYEEVHNSYPAGFDVPPEGNYLGWGWHLKILPYMNSADLYDKLEPHFAKGIHGLPNAPEIQKPLPLLWCPSDNGTETVPHGKIVTAKVVDGIVTEATEDWLYRLPHASYFGNAGYLQKEAGGIQPNAAGIPTSIVPLVNKGSLGSLGNFGTKNAVEHRYCDQKSFGGYFGQNSQVKPQDVIDGTSNTLMIGERYSPADSSSSAVGHGTWIGVPDCTRAQGLAMTLGDASVRINIGMPLREQTTGFGSLHHGGVFFALGDGSVRFVSQELDLVLFRALSVIDDGARPW